MAGKVTQITDERNFHQRKNDKFKLVVAILEKTTLEILVHIKYDKDS